MPFVLGNFKANDEESEEDESADPIPKKKRKNDTKALNRAFDGLERIES
jgi:hypothetical protein